MADKKWDNGGSAYPIVLETSISWHCEMGATLWDFYAAHALTMLRRGDANFPKDYASHAAEIADAMIAERRKRERGE